MKSRIQDSGFRIQGRSSDFTRSSILSVAVAAQAAGTARPAPCGCNPDETPSHSTKRANNARQAAGYLSSKGFTLVEMIVVMVITGILGGMIAIFIRWPVQGYVDSARRAEMMDIADTALRRITRDLRLALPNSVRITLVGSVYYLEFIPTTGGGRYRASSGVAGDNILDLTAPDISFDVLGVSPVFASGVSIVIDNTSATGVSSVYSGYNRAACPVATPYCASTNASTLQPSITLAAAKQFPSPSPGNRFQVISAPVTYVCTPAAGGAGGMLMRYWGYAYTDPQPTALATLTSANPGARMAANVSACSIVLASSGLVTLNFTITESGESISLYEAAHVANVP